MKKIFVFVLIVVVVGLGGFWLYSKNNKVVSKRTGPLEKVSLKLKWLDQAQFAGNYVAKDKGFYMNEGLDVSFVPFSYEETAINAVLKGKADFGIAGAEEVLVARSEGKSVKAIAVIYKINPGVFFSLKNSGITKPQDFVGKRIGVQKGVNSEYLYQAMMGKLKIDRSKITEVPVGYDYKELYSGDVVASVGYVINKPTAAGNEVATNSILMADYGVNMYADVLFTTDEMIKTRPEIVQKMVLATLKGWQYAIEYEGEAVDITMKYAKDSTKTAQATMLSSSIPLINTSMSKLGWMEQSQWQQAQNILFDQKIIKDKTVITDVFTMQFLEAMYK